MRILLEFGLLHKGIDFAVEPEVVILVDCEKIGAKLYFTDVDNTVVAVNYHINLCAVVPFCTPRQDVGIDACNAEGVFYLLTVYITDLLKCKPAPSIQLRRPLIVSPKSRAVSLVQHLEIHIKKRKQVYEFVSQISRCFAVQRVRHNEIVGFQRPQNLRKSAARWNFQTVRNLLPCHSVATCA